MTKVTLPALTAWITIEKPQCYRRHSPDEHEDDCTMWRDYASSEAGIWVEPYSSYGWTAIKFKAHGDQDIAIILLDHDLRDLIKALAVML
jgi:hypothetical protein